MGRLFLLDKEGPVYRCSTPTCGLQIAESDARLADTSRRLMNATSASDEWFSLHLFRDAYNIITHDDNLVNYGGIRDWGYEVSCINCLSLLGWRDSVSRIRSLFFFKYDRVLPQPENLPPPANQ